MINSIKKYFFGPGKQNTKETKNSILFSVNKNQEIDISIKILDKSTSSLQSFGLLLFLLNEGYYVQTILEKLTQIAKINTDSNQSIQDIISIWSANVAETDGGYDIQGVPIVSPTQFSSGK